MLSLSSFLALLAFTIAACLYLPRRPKNRPLFNIRGPKSPSFIFGHLISLNHQEVAGELEYQWIHKYGQACKIKGSLGHEILMLADPKALHHILQVSGYRYPKPTAANQSIMLLMGRGIIAAAGDDHKRHRKIMNPAFELSRVRSFLPLFHSSVKKLATQWETEIKHTNGSQPIKVNKGLSLLMLDNIGEAAFEHRFKMLEGGAEGELTDAFTNILADSHLYMDKGTILFTSLWRFASPKVLRMIEYIPARQIRQLRHHLQIIKNAAKDVIERRKRERDGAEDEDMLSILVKSSLSADIKKRLDEDELLSQVSTIMFAAHDSMTNALTWLLDDLAHHRKDQQRVRDEVARVKAASATPDELTAPELESMEFTNAVIRESLRLHPAVFALPRTAAEDDVIPLATPIRKTDGSYTSEISVKKGQDFYISVYTYQRLKCVWGRDANEWNPERFLQDDARKEYPMGVVADLLSFSGGVRGCLGWKFAILELQATLTALIDKFDFSPVPGVEIIGAPAGSMIPIVKGRAHEGSQVPLHVCVCK